MLIKNGKNEYINAVSDSTNFGVDDFCFRVKPTKPRPRSGTIIHHARMTFPVDPEHFGISKYPSLSSNR